MVFVDFALEDGADVMVGGVEGVCAKVDLIESFIQNGKSLFKVGTLFLENHILRKLLNCFAPAERIRENSGLHRIFDEEEREKVNPAEDHETKHYA